MIGVWGTLLNAHWGDLGSFKKLIMFRPHPRDSDPTALGEARPGIRLFQNFPGDPSAQLGLSTTGLDTEL